MARQRLRLYLWRDVLCDYTCGMAFAVAASADEARGIIVREDGIYTSAGNDFASDPEVHELTEPFCAFVYGGG